MSVKDSNLSLGADLQPVAQVHSCLSKQGMQNQQWQGEVVDVIPAEDPHAFERYQFLGMADSVA